MKFVSNLSHNEIITLQNMFKYHPSPQVKPRANSILLSGNNLSLQLIATILGICRQTVSTWLNSWETKGICGLYDEPGRGRKPTFSKDQDAEIIEQVQENPRSLNFVLAEIEKIYGVTITKATLKRLCKRAKLSWKRVRKSLTGKRNNDKFYAALEEINGLIDQANKGKHELYYFDESGFTLEPCVPYAWQPISETIKVPSSHSKRLNVLGFLKHTSSDFKSYVIEGSVTSDVVVAIFDEFANTITKKTIVVIDNASMHTSKTFLANVKKWEDKGLILQNIPPYSPELNKIEILWRKIKYEWLNFSAYKSFKSLKESLNHILSNIGSEYRIKFS